MLIPYLFAFCTCVFLTVSSYSSRYARAAGYPPTQFCLDFSCLMGSTYFVGFIYECIYGEGYPIACVLAMSVAGSSLLVAFILLNAAILSGKGALAIALS